MRARHTRCIHIGHRSLIAYILQALPASVHDLFSKHPSTHLLTPRSWISSEATRTSQTIHIRCGKWLLSQLSELNLVLRRYSQSSISFHSRRRVSGVHFCSTSIPCNQHATPSIMHNVRSDHHTIFSFLGRWERWRRRPLLTLRKIFQQARERIQTQLLLSNSTWQGPQHGRHSKTSTLCIKRTIDPPKSLRPDASQNCLVTLSLFPDILGVHWLSNWNLTVWAYSRISENNSAFRATSSNLCWFFGWVESHFDIQAALQKRRKLYTTSHTQA